ncbi:hypothetical protein E4K10_21040 [Streptomyces sp. T1317-0309]|nr:hypothetical protein E4K10_21040 [Streptomyces sp. T1317-0309]
MLAGLVLLVVSAVVVVLLFAVSAAFDGGGSVAVSGVLPAPLTVTVLVTCFGALQDALTVSAIGG